MSDQERRVRERAYAIWEREGRPLDRHGEHWAMAQKEIEDEEPASPQAVADAAKPDALPSPVKTRRSGATGAPDPQPALRRRRPSGASWTPADIKPAAETKPPRSRRLPTTPPK